MSVAITTFLVGVICSSMLLAGRALPDENSPADAGVRAAGVADELAADMQYATAVTYRSEHAVEFKTADRNGDEVPESIRYEWSGVPGDPLTRSYNGGTAKEVLGNVQTFELSYDLEVLSKEVPSGNESPETLLIACPGNAYLASRSIESAEWCGQYFKPSLPADAVSWKVSRVQFYAKAGGSTKGEASVQLRLATEGGYPSDAVLEEKSLLEETLLEDYLKQEFSFGGVCGIPPDQGLCLVIKHVSDAEACKVLTQYAYFDSSRTWMVWTGDAGTSWTRPLGDSMLIWVYGTVTTAGTPVIEQTRRLKGVQIKLAAGEGATRRITAGVRTLNAPEVIE